MKVGERRKGPTCIELDRDSLSLDNGCELRGLAGRVRVRTELAAGQLWYLRIVDSPSLRTLDLSEAPAGFDLELDSSSHPDEVQLPRGGASVLMSVAGGFPATVFRGWINECQIHCFGEHPVAGFYRMTDCDGLAFLPTGELERHGDIQRYVRIDQSERGLQSKRLRPRIKPDEVFWNLLDPRDDKHRAIGRLMAMRPDEFSRLALGSSQGIERRRRGLLEDRRSRSWTGAQLLRLFRRGFNPRAIWAWHCMVARARADDPAPERLGPALLKAGVDGSDGVSGPPRPSVPGVSYLRLLLLCRPTGLTRRSERHLREKGEPLALQSLAAMAASLPGGHPWLSLLEAMIRASMHRWRHLAALARADVDRSCWQTWRIVTRPRSARRYLEGLAHCSRRLPAENLRDRLAEFTCEQLKPRDRVRLGVELCEEGVAGFGRYLIGSGLQDSAGCGPELHARAMRCLLGSE
ncbi:MAG: hypothetical protein U5L08_07910 [Xanthomonadales bacterium]|nr:hypothetical protein [Xanthomonadales bacterium]